MPTDTLVILCVDAICVVAVVVAFVRGKPGFVVPLAEAVVILPVSLLGVFGMGLTIDQLQYTGHIPTQPAPVENLIELTAAFIGVVALWTALLVPPSWWARLPIVATLIVAGLFAGIVVSARFIAEWHQLGYGTVTNPAAYILFLPVLVAVHQAVRIARHLMCKTRIATSLTEARARRSFTRKSITIPLWVRLAIALAGAAALTLLVYVLTLDDSGRVGGKAAFVGGVIALPWILGARSGWSTALSMAFAFVTCFAVCSLAVWVLTRERYPRDANRTSDAE